MKKIYTYIIMLTCVIFFASCQKDSVLLTADIEGYNGENNSKVYIEGTDYFACWHIGDMVRVNSEVVRVELSDNGQKAKLQASPGRNSYTAAYPSKLMSEYDDCSDGRVTATLGNEQKYEEKVSPSNQNEQFVQALMTAHTTKGGHLAFRNAGALLGVVIQNNIAKNGDIKIKQISIQSNNSILWGDVTITDADNREMKVTNTRDDKNFIKLTFPTEYLIRQGTYKSFYIAIPPVTSTKFIIKVEYVDGSNKLHYFTTNETNDLTIGRSNLLRIGIDFSREIGEDVEKKLVGGGISENPYIISSLSDLNVMQVMCAEEAGLKDVYFLQDADISLSTNFMGIGTKEIPFCGVYMGGSHKIEYTNSVDSVGVFNYLGTGATISDLKVINKLNNQSLKKSNALEGGIVDVIKGNVTIINCENLGEIYSEHTNAILGGICGKIESGVVNIQDCINRASIRHKYATTAQIGGFCGSVSSGAILNILNCENYGPIHGEVYDGEVTFSKLGGFVGYAEGTLTLDKCVNNAEIGQMDQYEMGVYGGLIGVGSNNTISISNSVNHGDVQVGYVTGGFVGQGHTIYIMNSYTDGALNNGFFNIGGFVGIVSSLLDVNNAYVNLADLQNFPEGSSVAWVVSDISSRPTITCSNVFYPIGLNKPVAGTTTSYDDLCTATTIISDNDPGYMSTLNTVATAHEGWSDWYWGGQARLSCFPH